MKKDKYLSLLKDKYKLFPREVFAFTRKMGVELEFQIAPLDGKEPKIDVLKNLLNEMLPEFGFESIESDNDRNSIKGRKDGDLISYECSYSMLEISIAPHLNIHDISKKSNYYIHKIQNFLKKYNLTLLPLGINPFDWGTKTPFMNTDYLITLNYLFDDFKLKRKYSFKNTTAFISASQVHLDLSLDELPKYINLLNKLGWVKALLFANSPNVINKNEKCNSLRDVLWRDCALAYNATNVGERKNNFNAYEEVFLDTLENSIYYVKRGNKTIYFQPRVLKEFLQIKNIFGWQVENGKKLQVELTPQDSDIQFSRPYNSIVITTKGTVEIRSECSQPFEGSMSHLAFHVGIINNIEKIQKHILSIEEKTQNYSYKELREKAIYEDYDMQKYMSFNIEKYVYELLLLIKEGLTIRNKQEESYLNCLFERLKNRSNPAIEWKDKLDRRYTPVEIINETPIQSETSCV